MHTIKCDYSKILTYSVHPFSSLLLLLIIPCRQYVPRQQQITIDFASIEGAVYDVKPSHDTSIVENSSCQQ